MFPCDFCPLILFTVILCISISVCRITNFVAIYSVCVQLCREQAIFIYLYFIVYCIFIMCFCCILETESTDYQGIVAHAVVLTQMENILLCDLCHECHVLIQIGVDYDCAVV